MQRLWYLLQQLELRHPSEGDLQAVPRGKGQKDGVGVGRWGGKCGGLGFPLTRCHLPSRHSPPGGLNLSRKALLISFLSLCPFFICLTAVVSWEISHSASLFSFFC